MEKFALLIGVSESSEEDLPKLPSAIEDIKAMQAVLQDPKLGNFDSVKVLPNPTRQEMEEEIETLFANRKKEDLVLLYFSGHGITDENGKLYLVTPQTRKERGNLIKATAVAATVLHDNMGNSRSKYQVLILDSCFSGAIAEGLTGKSAGSKVDIQRELGGEGRAILTSSNAVQESFHIQGYDLSVYTHYLIDGIQTGAANQDGDDYISVDELHEYVKKKLEQETPLMSPQFFPVREGYKIRLVRSPHDLRCQEQNLSLSERNYKFELEINFPERLIGRDQLLEKLEDLLIRSQCQCNIVGIYGIPGVGKSALAAYFASKHRTDWDNFPDGIVALRVNDKDTEMLLKELSRYLEPTIEKEALTDISATVQRLLRGKRALLIFDNADRARDLEKIRELIEVAKRYCFVIVTSRRIDLLYELDISDEGLINVEVLPEKEALDLLEMCLQRKAKVIGRSLNAATTITNLLGGLPLALQIAGRTLRMRLAKPGLPNLESYARLLEQAREEWRLPGDLVKSDDPERNLRISFHLSLKQLRQKEADFFICLSICPSDQFSRDEAEAVGEVIGLKRSQDIDQCFYAIWDVSLIDFVENGAELLESSEADDRYQLHPLIHQFAAEELANRPDLKERVERQYANYFINLLKSSSNQKINEHLDSMVRVAKLLNEQDREEYNFAKYILDYFERNQSARRHGVRIATEFYNLSKRLENWQELVDFGFRKVDFLSLLNEYESGIETLTQMQPLLSNITNEECRLLNIAKLLNRRGGLCSKERLYPDAMRDFDESLSIGRRLGNEHHVSIALNSRGSCLEDQGQLDQAKQDFEESLSISRRLLTNQHSYVLNKHTGQVLTSLGRIYQRLGDRRKSESNNYYSRAKEYLRESCEIRRRQSDDKSLAIALDSYGQILCKLKEFEQAESAFDESIDIEKRNGTNKGAGTVLNNKGAMLVEQEKYEAAIAAFKESLIFLSKVPDQKGLAMVHNRLGQAYEKIGELKLAIEEFKQSFEINEKKLRNSQKGLQDVAPRLIRLLKALGKDQESRQYCQRAKTIAPTIRC